MDAQTTLRVLTLAKEHMTMWQRIKAIWGAYLRATKHDHAYDESTGECECGKQEGTW